jgi:beta-lactamase superfamily II metal-dependent hydrolase
MLVSQLRGASVAVCLALSIGDHGIGGQTIAATVSNTLPPWTPGTLDIHHLATGRGNASFVQLPDGTTLLVDAGDVGGDAGTSASASRSAGASIVRYIRSMIADQSPRLDYAVVTHFHPDHMGRVSGTERKSSRGPYLRSGLTEVADDLPIATMIDRGYDYNPPAATDRAFANYRAFVEARTADGSMTHVVARAGAADQIVGRRKDERSSAYVVRVVSVNDRVWTGAGNASKIRFPPAASIGVPEDRPDENMCSVTLRITYGRFDYFTGGDQPGFPTPGAAAWHDLESDVARAIGPTDVHVVNHHGSIEAENLFWLATLQSRVMIVPAWAPTHPSPDVLKRMLSTRVYPKPRDVFVTELRDATKATIGPRAAQVASDHGHIVVRVEPGGARYWVVVVDDDAADSLRVRMVKGPYPSE